MSDSYVTYPVLLSTISRLASGNCDPEILYRKVDHAVKLYSSYLNSSARKQGEMSHLPSDQTLGFIPTVCPYSGESDAQNFDLWHEGREYITSISG